jgi:uncharacterized lipoprotein YmbA
MMTKPVPAVLAKLLCAGLLMLAGCVEIGSETAPSRFYVLSAAESTVAPAPDGVSLLVGPVTLPRYLDRPQIVTRPTPNQLDLAEYDRWGGRLDDNFGRVLAQNLSVHLNTGRVAIFPRDPRTSDSLQVSVDVARFEKVGSQNEVQLDTQWTVYPPERRGSPVVSSSRIRIKPAGEGMAETVAAMSEAVDRLAQEIAGATQKLAAR